MSKERVIKEIRKNGEKEWIRVRKIEEDSGRVRIDIRKYREDKYGNEYPTKKGVAMEAEDAKELALAIMSKIK